MEITRRGDDDDCGGSRPEAKAEIHCTGCGSVMKASQAEIHEDDCGMLHHHPGCDSFINCPVCGRLIPFRYKTLRWGA